MGPLCELSESSVFTTVKVVYSLILASSFFAWTTVSDQGIDHNGGENFLRDLAREIPYLMVDFSNVVND